MSHPTVLTIEPLTEAGFAPFGRVLGSPLPVTTGIAPDAFSHPGSDFWHAHDFSPGPGGQTEVLWVVYRDTGAVLRSLEAHWLTEQAVVPLGGQAIVQVVCTSRPDGSRSPDLAGLRAFRVETGWGICMNPGCWHGSIVIGAPVTCLMLTRRSTTLDLVAHLHGTSVAQETSIVSLAETGTLGVLIQA